MKARNVSIILLVLLVSACDALASAPTPTPVPLPPAQHMESAFQWLETHAMMKDNVDWTALRKDTADIISKAQTASDTLPAICKAIRELKDGNAWLVDPDFEIPIFYTGYIALYPENKVIVRIDRDSPAEKAGLHVGDRIEQVNNHPPIPYDVTDGYPPCNPKEIDTSTEEHLVINRDGQSMQIDVQRIKLTAVLDPYFPPMSQRFGVDPDGIGYVELIMETGAHLEYAGDVQKLMKSMDKPAVCGWMIDLRRNQGGDIWSYLAGVGPILGEGDLGGFEYLDGRREPWSYRNGEVLWNNEYRYESQVDGSIYKPKRVTPVALLTSPATQAAAELLLIAFEGLPDIRSFGEPTRGLPTLVTHTVLSDGTVLAVSGANSFDRNGTVHRGSIAPDMFVETDWSKFGTKQDPVILAAMDWLQSQSTCNP